MTEFIWLENIIFLYLKKENPEALERGIIELERNIRRIMRRSRKLKEQREKND